MFISSKSALFLFVSCLFSSSSFGQLKTIQWDTVQQITPPYQQFYSKYLNSGGIPIRSAEVVKDSALIIASKKLNMMLRNLPIARQNLIAHGAELHIIGKDQQTSDLPEFRHMKGVPFEDNGNMTDIDKRTRGLGGLYASCGEENLLNLPNDRYGGGNDICIHEFAHTLMSFGLDSVLQNKITIQYKSSIGKGLWKGAYASTNEQEYWAELTNWYFGGRGSEVPGQEHIPGPEWLKSYDPGGYNLLNIIYTGQISPGLISKKSQIVAEGIPSGNSAQSSMLVIVNNSTKKLKVSWIDWEGKSVFYADVLPSTIYNQSTFYTHVWRIDDDQAPIYIKIFDPLCEIKFRKDY